MPLIDLDQKTLDFATHANSLWTKKERLTDTEEVTLNVLVQAIALKVMYAVKEYNILNKK